MTHSRSASTRHWKRLLDVYMGLFFAFMYVPILLLVVLSFNDSKLIGLPFEGFTLNWYRTVLSDEVLLKSMVNSFAVGIVAALIGVALALALCLSFRKGLPLRGLVFNFMLLPIIIPGVVSGVVMLIGAGYAGAGYGLFTTTLVTHVTWILPFAFLSLYPRISRLDPGLDEAAMDLGARPREVFTRVIWPTIRPSVVATLLFSFTLSFDEFIRTLFVIGNDRTIPVYLWQLVIEQAAPFLPAVGVVMIAVSAAIALLGFAASARATSPSDDTG